MQQLLDRIAGLGALAYLIEGFLIFAEDALFFGFVFPGETVLALCAFLAQQHVLNVWLVLGIAVTAAIAGDQTGFEIGRRFGPSIEGSRVGRKVGPRWAVSRSFLSRHGPYAVFLGRWVAFLRALVPTTSGALGMHRRTFALWNTVGGLSWAAAWTALGYLAGASWERTAERFGEVTAALALLAFVVVYVSYSVHRRRREVTRTGA